MISAESNILLNAKIREGEKIRANKALREGLVLGIVYGKGIDKNIPVIIPKINLKKVLSESGEGTLIKLQLGEEKAPKDVIIQDIQYHTYTGDIVHVDFMSVSLEEEVEVDVPLDFIGVSPAVKDMGGILVQNAESVEIRCKAKDIPKTIAVDISILATFDDMIHLKDLKLPANIELLDNPDNVIALVEEPRSEKEMEELDEEAAADVSQVEGVEKEGEVKEGEEGGEKAAEAGETKKEETSEGKPEDNKS